MTALNLYRKQRVLPHLSSILQFAVYDTICNFQSFAQGVRHVQVSAAMKSLASRLWCCVLQAGYKRCLTCAAAANTPTKVCQFLHSSLYPGLMEHCNSRQAETVQVGFIGLGNMGSRMAKNLLHGGHELLVYDTSTTKLRAFCKDTGVASAASPSAVAAEAGGQAPACAWLLFSAPAASAGGISDSGAPGAQASSSQCSPAPST